MLFDNLLRLKNRNEKKTPLEDFTTELLCGILNSNERLKKSFILEFLKLPEGEYKLKTQVRYPLKNDRDCIVDFILESDSFVCFVENKVESIEGPRQLERYSLILDKLELNKHTKLIYCTKYNDPKTNISHDFKQIRWYQIATFLKKFGEDNIAQEFIYYLNKNDMEKELTLNAVDFLSLNNLQNVINKAHEYLDRVKPLFEDIFNSQKKLKVKDGFDIKQIIRHNRLIYYYQDIISSKGWSEIKYGFLFNGPVAYVGVWLEKTNPNYKKLIEYSKDYRNQFSIGELDQGLFVELKKDISCYLNDENAESQILNWYKDSFRQFSDFIKSTPEIEWNIHVQ